MRCESSPLFGSINGTVQTPAAISGATAIPGNQVVDARNLGNLSLIANWTGTLVGVINVQASNDKVNWITVGTIAVTTGTGSGRLALADFPDQYLQAFYAPTSGSGTLFALSNGKGF